MIEHDVAYGLERAIELAPNDGCPITLTIGECESLVSRLRQAEKDAARYRWLRDKACHSEWHTVGSADPSAWDCIVDEYIEESGDDSNN